MRSLLSFTCLALVAACGEVGIVCDRSGTTDGCGSGLICTYTEFIDFELADEPVNVCLRLCSTSENCGEGEVCRGVFCDEDGRASCQTGPLPVPPSDLCVRADSEPTDESETTAEAQLTD